MIIKSIFSVLIVSAILFISACSQQEEAAVSEADPMAAEASAQPAAGGPGNLTPEQRAAARAARMALSESTDFNMDPLLDPNTATQEQLSAVPGLSTAQVQAILDGRPFATPTELHAAIADGASYEDMFDTYSAVFVKVNINHGETEDYMMIPTTLTPEHIAREVEEYRPYEDLQADFSREMMKYVSEKEVAFLERFVTIE